MKVRRLSPRPTQSHARHADATGTPSWTASPRPLSRVIGRNGQSPFWRDGATLGTFHRRDFTYTVQGFLFVKPPWGHQLSSPLRGLRHLRAVALRRSFLTAIHLEPLRFDFPATAWQSPGIRLAAHGLWASRKKILRGYEVLADAGG